MFTSSESAKLQFTTTRLFGAVTWVAFGLTLMSLMPSVTQGAVFLVTSIAAASAMLMRGMAASVYAAAVAWLLILFGLVVVAFCWLACALMFG